MRDLQPATRYYYTLVQHGVGVGARSRVRSFLTAPAPMGPAITGGGTTEVLLLADVGTRLAVMTNTMAGPVLLPPAY